MTTNTITRDASEKVAAAGDLLARYGLVTVIVWFGALKFMAYEAEGIAPLISESPLMSWLYDFFSVRTFSALLGVFELAAAALIAIKPWSPKLSMFGSLLAIALFVATITFMFTTPGVFAASQGGFPALAESGYFLVKDIVLLGVSVWTLGDALRAIAAQETKV
jgi:uncharacterized membrane protein YkgB